MNKKELNELRRRLAPEKCAISKIYGCYVNGAKEIVSEVDIPLGSVSEDDATSYLALLKKSLSGTLGKNLIDIVFSTQQLMDSEEHRLLSALRESALEDAEVRQQFYRCVTEALDMDGENYVSRKTGTGTCMGDGWNSFWKGCMRGSRKARLKRR